MLKMSVVDVETFGQDPFDYPAQAPYRQQPGDPDYRKDQADGERSGGFGRQRSAENHQHACAHHRRQHREIQEPLGQNGPERTAHALRYWCRFTGTGTSYIEPGSPWENPWVESYGSRMRDELLAIEQFVSLLEAQVLVDDWRTEYNTYRPHSSLDGLTPADYAEQWRQTNQSESAAISSAPVDRQRDRKL
jgi:Integrase core domain